MIHEKVEKEKRKKEKDASFGPTVEKQVSRVDRWARHACRSAESADEPICHESVDTRQGRRILSGPVNVVSLVQLL